MYTLNLEVKDLVGNSGKGSSSPFFIIDNEPTLKIEFSSRIPVNPKFAKSPLYSTPAPFKVLYELNPSFGLREIRWKLKKETEKRETLFLTQKAAENFYLLDLLKTETLVDGRYRLSAEVEYAYGETLKALSAFFEVDTTAPNSHLTVSPKIRFSPDMDGILDKLTIDFKNSDNGGVKKTKIYIMREEEDWPKLDNDRVLLETLLARGEVVLKTWEWDGMTTNKLSWNGLGDDNKLKVESAYNYRLFLVTVDHALNAHVQSERFGVDVLVIPIAKKKGMSARVEYKIQINNILFKYKKAKMIGDYQKTLNRLVEILHKFGEYVILLLGHTDSRGTEEYNQSLSERRAKKVYDYLIANGIASERLERKGVGESELLVSPEVVTDRKFTKAQRNRLTEDNYRQNRRVEFYLIRPEKRKLSTP